MTRIIGGASRGRSIAVPEAGTRPTGDRAREGLFSTLSTMVDLDGAVVVDLYAGSGAIGLEALSRGARAVTLVESDARAARVIQANIAHLGMSGATVEQMGVGQFLRAGPGRRHMSGQTLERAAPDVVFLDPPYDHAVDADLAALVEYGWLGVETVVCVERASRDRTMTWPPGMVAIKERRYGIATLWYGRRS